MLATVTTRRVWRFATFTRVYSTRQTTSAPVSKPTPTVSEPKPFYITTPIFYPNAAPHIGHLYSLLVGDVIARFQRLKHPDGPVHFLVGTDEHGLKIQNAAIKRGLKPQVFCDELSARFKELASKADISYTRFMRTSHHEHHEAVSYVWRDLEAKGLIYKGEYSGWYSITDECFYTEAQVSRNKSKQVTSMETGSVVEWVTETNYMFRLSTFRYFLMAHYENNPDLITPASQHAAIVQTLESTPLDDLSISRPRSRLSWGVPVPSDPEQTIYVWFDALLVYLSGLGYPGTGGQSPVGWPANLQVIGKDIMKFHAIHFPAILEALKLPIPTRLLSHAHWTVDQRKMSKSVGNVVDPLEVMQKYGVDVVRYYMARVGGRFHNDVDWSAPQLEKFDKEIQSLLGNLFLRITGKKIIANFEKAEREDLYTVSRSFDKSNTALLSQLHFIPQSVASNLERLEIGEALQDIVDLLNQANQAITVNAPWEGDPDHAYACYSVFMETLRIAGICLQPFMPRAATRLLDGLGVEKSERTWEHAAVRERKPAPRPATLALGARFFPQKVQTATSKP